MSIKGSQSASQPESTFELIKNHLLSTAGAITKGIKKNKSDPIYYIL